MNKCFFWLWVISLSSALTTSASEVVYDSNVPQLDFAAKKVEVALRDSGEDNAVVRLLIAPDGGKAESFSIERKSGGEIVITGSDAAGAMYGGLEVAEELKIGGVKAVLDDRQGPAMDMRGIKFNIPLDVRTPSYSDMSDSAQNNIENIWDLEFWKSFIDEAAGHRYNYISLWSLHPFPSMVKVPDYPDVALDDVKRSTNIYGKEFSGRCLDYEEPEVMDHLETIKKITIDEKIAFWKEVMRYGKSRNVDFYIVTWNIYTFGIDGKYGIDDNVKNKTTIDYFRKSVKQLFLTYPDLKGIGLTTGENMPKVNTQRKEDWAFNTYGEGVLDVVKEQPERKITFLHRQHEAGALDIAKKFKPLVDHPNVDFLFSFKYAKAHAYSSTKQIYHQKFLRDIQKDTSLQTIWTMRNDSVYLYRWAAPDFMREFVNNIPMEPTRGYYFGSDGWICAREYLSKNPQSPRQLELNKFWFQWMLWGRLAYDPTITNERFTGILQSRFPSVDACKMMDAWQAASMVFPITTGFHWGKLDYQWYPEACKSKGPPARNKTGFHDVNRFITLGTHSGTGYVSIPDYVDLVKKGKPFTQTGPLEVAQMLHDNADKALAFIKTTSASGDRELSETLGDIESMAYLGRYYAHKITGATQLHLYRKTKEKLYQQKAVEELVKAAAVWRQYTASSLKRYTNPVWMNRVYTIDWKEITQWVDEDIDIARK